MRLEFSEHPILVVDDELPNLELIERFLRRKYRNVVVAHDSEQALWYLETQGVHLVIADQKMPKLEGIALLNHARRLQPNAMRVLVTGYVDVETLTSAINAAAVYHVITKPIDFKVLDMTVLRALEAHEAVEREHELFDAFVYASVSAMEQRDPTTAGHSFRVAQMTTGLAMVVDKISDGPLAGVKFSREDLEQLKYASLLHDFGKIGVPEEILLKPRKLPKARSENIAQRINYGAAAGHWDGRQAEKLAGLLRTLDDPGLSAAAHAAEIATLVEAGVVDDEDLEYLRIESGSLSPAERRLIESHVQNTVRFLKQIPWPRRLARVTEIAAGHHEKLNGRGYPLGTSDIPVESRMMAICDIYDALCANDRPYRVAASHERAVEILTSMRDAGELDPLLLEIFLDRRVYQALKQHKRHMRPGTE